MRIRPRPARTAALAAAAVTAGMLAGGPAQAVVGTPATDSAYAFTARLEIGEGDAQRACSGALVEPGWILTSASCFAENPLRSTEITPGKPALKTIATVGLTASSGDGGHVSEIVDLVPRAGRDLVLARLAEPAAGIAPVAVAATSAGAGDTLTAAGFGRTRTEWAPDRLHTASFAVDAVEQGTLGISGKTAADAICKGDTGGPVLRQANGRTELVGVSSRSWQGGCFGTPESETRTGAVAARADGIALGSRLTAGQRLLPGDSLSSTAARLTMRADGNLVVTSRAGKTLWSAGTAGNAGATALFGEDGNLVVRDAAGADTLWESGTGAAGGSVVLRDRGDLVVLNGQGVSQWSSGTAVRHDHNGDGRSDLGAWYDFSAGSDATYTFFGNEDGAISAPKKSFTAAVGAWEAKYMKFVTGDFNGDGRGDMAAAYGYSDTSVKVWVALAKPDGGFGTPYTAWSAPAGSFHISYMTPQAGDFNGDGVDDLAVWYAYADGTSKLWTFTADGKGKFNAPVGSWSAPKGTWLRSRAKFTTGDFNGDGRDDLAVFYGQGDNSVKTYVFTGRPDGGFADPAVWWHSPSLDWNRTTPHAGDFNGDGRDDALVWYDYPDGSDRTSTMLSEKSGGRDRFGSARITLASKPGNLDAGRMQQVVGDYDGDGRDDLAILNHQSDGAVKMWTWTARPNAMFNGAIAGWTAPAKSWVYASTELFRPYN
ncbi:FG-GAP-like repeat-containing protein [Streptomyces sp. HNM0663]|uniref:FG-GAP-like repeat-containing protein n=1 Tax=Streptomyces chengmaiensis TaxID=3040919 RepID=A0ABT6HFA5_9ACTN|nr:FG-GAP-like repeat-containing protein [Streptomyces chengmaiensis]MDH2387245.1 FG-GAP-like repeat-containing protein [Streptomyces chengmaiensis]